MSSIAKMPAGSYGKLDDLLQHAASQCRQTERALLALARLDPAAAAEWLLDAEPQLRDALRPAQLAEALAETLHSGLADPAAQPVLLQLGQRYSDLVPVAPLDRLLASTLPQPAAQSLLEALLKRDPRSPELLRLAAKAAAERSDTAAAHTYLTRLGRADPRLATLTHVARSRAALPKLEQPQVRLAFLGSYTIDPLLPFIELECAELGLAPVTYIAPFNSWAQESLNPASKLYSFAPEIVFFALALDDLVPELSGCPNAERLQALGEQALQRVLEVVEQAAAQSDALIVVHSFFSAYRDPLGIARTGEHIHRSAWIAELNRRLHDALQPQQRVRVLDVQDALLRRADGALENPKMRHFASMRLGERALSEIARLSAGYVAAHKGLTRKCVVLDLDNTLWGGVVGEEGPHGIKLGNTSPGSEFLELQRYLQSLSERGVLLAINSKNNPDDAREALVHNEWMLLREDAFSAVVMNWSPKPDNMRQIARELNIGLDALIFIDDNPNERELMRQALPEVLTPELPADPALYRAVLETLPQLQMLGVTQEDRKRVELYRSGKQREASRAQATNLEDYLRSLDIQAVVAQASDKTLPRIHQLFQRTNQFNVTTRRYELETLRTLAETGEGRLYGLSARDRFGDHGLVAVALVRLQRDVWRIDSFLMSCRVIGYGIESALLALIARDAERAGAARLLGEFIPTAKNKPAEDIYRKHGFAPAGEDAGISLWELDLRTGGIASPAWVSITEEKQ